MKKIAVIVMTLTLCLACSGALALSVTGLETESVTREWETSSFFTRMQELTGIAVEARAVYEEEDYEKLIASMIKGDIGSDVLFKAALTREEEYALMESGAVIDLAPLIDEYMPNLSALLAAHPEWKEIITLDDGRIASLPLINQAERQVLVWINAAWLDKLGVAMPTTLDELTQALEAIKAGDPNGNYKADEIAADLLGVFEMRWLLPYFGIVADDYNLAHNESGEIVFAPELPAYREFIALLRDWNERGLLGSEAFTGTHTALAYSSAEDDDEEKAVVSGLLVSVTPYTTVSVDATMDYEPVILAAPDGNLYWRDFLGEIWTGCFAVTSACENPGEALAWVDALYSEEGAVLAYAGLEGEDYAYDEQGRWNFITSSMQDITDIRANSLMYTGTTMPGLAPSNFLANVNSDIDVHVLNAGNQVRDFAQQVSPAYALSRENQKKADELAITLGKLVDEGIARFATGEVELTDENYDAWLSEMKAAGSDALVELFQNQ